MSGAEILNELLALTHQASRDCATDRIIALPVGLLNDHGWRSFAECYRRLTANFFRVFPVPHQRRLPWNRKRVKRATIDLDVRAAIAVE